ncbi:MAG: DUF5667 domain-containing protein [Patescibacteria group bacterium]|nr:DUF5667 domain-containing protein [Patescibacteria group bacterium]
MDNKDLIGKIKKLKKVEPSKEWLVSARQDLIEQIGFEEPLGFFEWMKHGQSLALAFCLILIFVGGPWLTLKASQLSLPGELLYSVKRAGENVQSVTALGEKKSQLQGDFACRRLEELTRITENDPFLSETDEKAKKVVSEFRDSLANFSQDIDKISKEQAVAAVIQTKKIKNNLDKAQENAPSDIKEDLAQAEETIKDINQQILAVLTADSYEVGTTTPDHEILIFLRELESGGTTTTEERANECR